MTQIAKRLELRTQGIACFGPSWIGRSEILFKTAKLATNLTFYLYENEFDVKSRPEIAKFFTKNKIEGTWPDWWRPVSLLYGQELAINHLIENADEKKINEKHVDAGTCWKSPAIFHSHIHAIHDDCEFQKFRFMDPLVDSIEQKKSFEKRLEFAQERNALNFTVAEYCKYLAWNSLIQFENYFKQFYSKNELN